MSRKKLGFPQAIAIGLGNIIGAGIFVLAGSAINASGSGALVAFAITAALALSVGLNTAELSSRYPRVQGGVYSFARETMGDTFGFLVGWFRLIAYAVSGAAVALGFSGYLVSLGAPSSIYYVTAALLIALLALVEVRGIRLAAEMEIGLVLVKIIGLGIFLGAVFMLARYTSANFTPVFPNGGLGVLLAANIAFFAYSGFNTIATLTPDVENGERIVPRAIITSIIVSTVLYVLVVFGLLISLDWRGYGVASNPLSLALANIQAPSVVSYSVDIAALAATFAVTLSLTIAGARTVKQMGEDKLLPASLVRGSRMPGFLIAVIMIASLGLGNVGTIALVANFGVIFSYMLTGVQVTIARKNHSQSVFRSPGYPYVQIFSVLLSIIMLLTLGPTSLTLGAATLVAGLVVHSVYTHLHSNRKEM